MFNVGDKFESFEQFQSKLREYEKTTFNNYWIRDCRTLKTQVHRFPNGVAAKATANLKYYHLRIACIKGGKQHVAKNNTRKTLTFKQGCAAGMFLKISSCGKYLRLQEFNEQHNHTVSKTLFNTLPHQRVNVPAEAEIKAVPVRRNKKIMKSKVREQKLTGLSNLKSKNPECKRGFAECVDMLKSIYNCDVDVLGDCEANLRCLFFQDAEMKKMFAVYPEIIFVDGTCRGASRPAIYLIMVEDSEGNGAVVAVGILFKDNEATIDWFISRFKTHNPRTINVKVIMSAKDSKERLAFNRNFPDASLQICLFHLVKTLNRQVNLKTMNISVEQCENAREFLTKLAHSSSEDAYAEELKNMKASVPKIIYDYYLENWHPIKDQWVLYLTFNNRSFLKNTNNKLENLHKQLKSVILRYSKLEAFIKSFFVCISSARVNRLISNSVQLHKVSTNLLAKKSPEYAYKNYLTNYAFEKVQQQISLWNDCSNFQLFDDITCLAPTAEGLLEVTEKTCECLFFSSTGLPCRHIFHYRSLMNLPFFDKDICSSRWTRRYFETEHPGFNLKNAERKESNAGKPRALTDHQKFKRMNDECLKVAKLCSEVSSTVFYKRLEIIKSLVRGWSNEGEDNETLINDTQELELECDSAECMDTDYESNND